VNKLPRSFGTHDGSFHADEITACALLIIFDLIDRDKIIRTRDAKKLKKCDFVCDVGGKYEPANKRFDHHQKEYQGALSGAGMILLYLLEIGKINQHEYDFFNESMIRGIDDEDNGKRPRMSGFCTYSNIIANFVPAKISTTEQEMTEAFYQALDFAINNFQRLRGRYQYLYSYRDVVEMEMKKNREYLEFEKHIPWIDLFFDMGGESHPALFVVMPARNHWCIRGIPPNNKDRMKVRFAFPKKWEGLLDQNLEKASGIKGAVFCHKGRFISIWKTKEDAFEALEKILKTRKEEKR